MKLTSFTSFNNRQRIAYIQDQHIQSCEDDILSARRPAVHRRIPACSISGLQPSAVSTGDIWLPSWIKIKNKYLYEV